MASKQNKRKKEAKRRNKEKLKEKDYYYIYVIMDKVRSINARSIEYQSYYDDGGKSILFYLVFLNSFYKFSWNSKMPNAEFMEN